MAKFLETLSLTLIINNVQELRDRFSLFNSAMNDRVVIVRRGRRSDTCPVLTLYIGILCKRYAKSRLTYKRKWSPENSTH